MASIRTTKTASGSVAIQVVSYAHRKVVILKHIGSGHTSAEIKTFMAAARTWIDQHVQSSLFPAAQSRLLNLNACRYVGVRHMFAYHLLTAIINRCGFTALDNPLLLDLALMRIVEPASKLRSVELLFRYFGIRYAMRSVYRALPKMEACKKLAEEIAISCANNTLGNTLAFVLYDVTTLYFETFEADDLRKPGFSKDNKSNQPQVVVGLLTTTQGFPLGYEVFAGHTFEGKTMLPVVEEFMARQGVNNVTVVADAAMMGMGNIAELQRRGMTYIVGARTGNLAHAHIVALASALGKRDGATTRIATDHGDLVCAFSEKRFRKDTREMEKQIAKANALVNNTALIKHAKFVRVGAHKGAHALNEALIEKTKLLLGIKGYYTNIPRETCSDADIIARYHELWHVEQAFRMAKSDLVTRPIFHHKEQAIKAHLAICFIALAIGKYLEITTGLSLRRVVELLWSVTEARIIDTKTNEEVTLQSDISKDIRSLLAQLDLSY